MEMRGLKVAITNIAETIAVITKASEGWVKIKRLPLVKSAKNARIVRRVCCAGGVWTMRIVDNMMPEKRKLPASRTKHGFSPNQAINAPANAGESRRTV